MPNFSDVPLSTIVDCRFQARSEYAEIESLARSIYRDGLLEPVAGRVVTEPGGPIMRDDDQMPVLDARKALRASDTAVLELIFGHRRVRAFRYMIEREDAFPLEGAHLYTREVLRDGVLPVRIRPITDEEVYRAIVAENNDREDLNVVEQARQIKLGREEGMTNQQLASLFGRSPSWVSNRLRLLRLSDAMQAALAEGDITARQAEALLPLYEMSDAEREAAADAPHEIAPETIELDAVHGGVASGVLRERVQALQSHVETVLNPPLDLDHPPEVELPDAWHWERIDGESGPYSYVATHRLHAGVWLRAHGATPEAVVRHEEALSDAQRGRPAPSAQDLPDGWHWECSDAHGGRPHWHAAGDGHRTANSRVLGDVDAVAKRARELACNEEAGEGADEVSRAKEEGAEEVPHTTADLPPRWGRTEAGAIVSWRLDLTVCLEAESPVVAKTMERQWQSASDETRSQVGTLGLEAQGREDVGGVRVVWATTGGPGLHVVVDLKLPGEGIGESQIGPHPISQVEDVLEALDEYGASPETDRPETDRPKGMPIDRTCTWRYDLVEDAWHTDCRQAFQFVADGPEENEFVYCPFCSAEIAPTAVALAAPNRWEVEALLSPTTSSKGALLDDAEASSVGSLYVAWRVAVSRQDEERRTWLAQAVQEIHGTVAREDFTADEWTAVEALVEDMTAEAEVPV